MKGLHQFPKGKFIAGALFDLDGVLVDTESLYTEFWAYVDRLYPTGVYNFAQVIKGNTLDHILDTYFDPSLHADIVRILDDYERDMQYRMFDGVPELLDELHALGAGIAIVTSSNNAKMSSLFAQLPALREVADVIVTADYVTRSKPDPQGYLIAAKALGCEPQHCIVFEDSFAGLAAGRAAGAMVVGIATTNPAASLKGHADIILNHTKDFDTSLISQVSTDREPATTVSYRE